MYGHEPIIRMRMRGIKPNVVFISDFPCAVSRDWSNPGKKYGQVWPADNASVCTHGDSMSSIDMRFLVGLRVHISATTKERAKALFDKAKAAGAAMVVSTYGDAVEFFQFEKVGPNG